MSSASTAFSTLARHDLRAINKHLPRLRHILPAGRARACCFWTQTSLAQRSTSHLRSRVLQNRNLAWRTPFSTSTVLHTRPEDVSKHTPIATPSSDLQVGHGSLFVLPLCLLPLAAIYTFLFSTSVLSTLSIRAQDLAAFTTTNSIGGQWNMYQQLLSKG